MQAEEVYRQWQAKDPKYGTLESLGPRGVRVGTEVVYNLLHQIADEGFSMFGNGRHVKSMPLVKCRFFLFSVWVSSRAHVYNYVDKPDYDLMGWSRQ
jgi:hypothetical protein